MAVAIIHQSKLLFPTLQLNPEGDILLLDKPYRYTSFHVVDKIKRLARQMLDKKVKVGHAGTLDPLATGLLIVCTGAYTKKIPDLQDEEKEYTGTLRLGATTPSFDLEKEIDRVFPWQHITEDMLIHCCQRFVGELQQIPPMFSAVKIGGKRAFDYAREGKDVLIQPKKIVIREFELMNIVLPDIDFRVVCSKGTYIRALVRDFGEALQCGAHLVALRRTRIGKFRVEDALIPTNLGGNI
ncbi:MAG: tRNA pseudouridine(55) synthase TruB [Bacteroidales bacterium]|jgi:tRNA pseudouridine55 synthase|nr:tRNA pseudouridine(55) synthase TruB [Bacteroidales bacterium]